MISKVNPSVIKNTFDQTKMSQKNLDKVTTLSDKGDLSKVEEITKQIENGEYKINLDTLSQKIAEELL